MTLSGFEAKAKAAPQLRTAAMTIARSDWWLGAHRSAVPERVTASSTTWGEAERSGVGWVGVRWGRRA